MKLIQNKGDINIITPNSYKMSTDNSDSSESKNWRKKSRPFMVNRINNGSNYTKYRKDKKNGGFHNKFRSGGSGRNKSRGCSKYSPQSLSKRNHSPPSNMSTMTLDDLHKEQRTYCNNCGFYGHGYSQCKYPVYSYGIICFKQDIGSKNTNQIDNTKILMVRRKFSISIIDFLLKLSKTVSVADKNNAGNRQVGSAFAKQYIWNLDYITTLFERMTVGEREIISKAISQQSDAGTIYKELLCKFNIYGLATKPEYVKNVKFFSILLKGVRLYNNQRGIIDGDILSISNLLTTTTCEYTEPEWGFPKGRRSGCEKNIECATREFREETNLNKKDYNIVPFAFPLSESYVGSNNISYEVIFYFAKYNAVDTNNGDMNNNVLSVNGKHQKYEIGDIGWFTFKEANDRVRGYQRIRKENIIRAQKSIIDIYKRANIKQ